MGMDSPELLLFVENCPKGAETLVTRVIHILTDKGKIIWSGMKLESGFGQIEIYHTDQYCLVFNYLEKLIIKGCLLHFFLIEWENITYLAYRHRLRDER